MALGFLDTDDVGVGCLDRPHDAVEAHHRAAVLDVELHNAQRDGIRRPWCRSICDRGGGTESSHRDRQAKGKGAPETRTLAAADHADTLLRREALPVAAPKGHRRAVSAGAGRRFRIVAMRSACGTHPS
jgi:hypothetical protein